MDRTIQEKLRTFFRSYPLREYKKGEILIREGDPFSKMFFIRSGIVRLYTNSKNGRELSLLLYPSEYCFPSFLGFSNKDSEYNFKADTNLELYAAPKEEFLTFIKKSPDVMYGLIERGGLLIQRLIKRVEIFCTESSYIRTVAILPYLYQFHKNIRVGKEAQDITISHQELSTWIYTSRETVTRQIQILKRKGIVKCAKGRIRILDFVALRQSF